MQVTISYIGGDEKTADILPGDMVAFERKYNVSWAEVSDKPRVEHSFFLAWNALRRTGQETRDFDEFIDQVADLDTDEEEQAGPLAPSV